MSEKSQFSPKEHSQKHEPVPAVALAESTPGRTENFASDRTVQVRAGETLWQKALENYGSKVPLAALYEANNLTPEVYFDSHNKRHFKAPTILPDHKYVLPSPDKIKALEAAFWQRMKPSIKAAEDKANGKAEVDGKTKTNSNTEAAKPAIQEPKPIIRETVPAVEAPKAAAKDTQASSQTVERPPKAEQVVGDPNSPEAKMARNIAIVDDLLAQNHSFKASVSDNYWHGDQAKVREFKRICQENEDQILALRTLIQDKARFQEASEMLKTLSVYDATNKKRTLAFAQKFSFLKQKK